MASQDKAVGAYVPDPDVGCPMSCMIKCFPGMSMQIVAKDADTLVMKSQKCCWVIPLGGCPCPGCNLCGCGPLAFAPEFKKGIIAEHPDWYVGDGPMYAGRCCGGCNCCSNYSDVVKVEGKGVHYYGNMTPFCGKGMCCDPPPIDKAAALKAGNAKAPMMKMMKREPYKVDS